MASTPEQLINQAVRHSVMIESLKTQDYNRLREIIRDVNDTLVARLSRVREGSAWTRARLETQIANYDKLMKESYKKNVIPELRRQIEELAIYEAGFEIRSLGNVAPRHQFVMPTENQIMTAVNSTPLALGGRFQGTLLGELIDEFSAQQINTLKRSIRAAFTSGQTTQDLIRNLQREAFPLNDRQLSSVVRTSLQHSANQARQATWQSNSDIIKGVRWLSVLDNRTSTICQSLSGQIFPIDEGPRPPAHYQCRSTTVATLDDRFSFLEEGATQRARDPETGQVYQVDAKQTYYQWLKTQPQPVIDDIIGPTRGKLLTQGGLSAERFKELQLDKNFRPRTLEEIKKIEPLAFQRITPKED